MNKFSCWRNNIICSFGFGECIRLVIVVHVLWSKRLFCGCNADQVTFRFRPHAHFNIYLRANYKTSWYVVGNIYKISVRYVTMCREFFHLLAWEGRRNCASWGYLSLLKSIDILSICIGRFSRHVLEPPWNVIGRPVPTHMFYFNAFGTENKYIYFGRFQKANIWFERFLGPLTLWILLQTRLPPLLWDTIGSIGRLAPPQTPLLSWRDSSPRFSALNFAKHERCGTWYKYYNDNTCMYIIV